MIKLFCGYDPREAIGFHVFVHSVLARASVPVSIVPMASMGLGQGSNAFTLSRFLVASLCEFEGRAIFADASDMLMLEDVAELDALFDPSKAVQVVQHDYRTRNPRKYIGTPMASSNIDYRRKNWASLMLINCAHDGWEIYPEDIRNVAPVSLLQFDFLKDEEIGELPAAWNVLADEGQPIDGAKILHHTCGIPAFEHYRNTPGAELWQRERALMEYV